MGVVLFVQGLIGDILQSSVSE